MNQHHSGRGGKREGAGRKIGSTTTPGRRQRNFRVTDEEYTKVKEFINKIRGKKEC